MYESPDLAGKVKGPVYVAPASRTIVSPGTALLIAACRFPPAGTTIVAAKAAEAEIVKIEITKNALVSLGRTQRIAAHSWEIRTFFSVQ